MQDFGICLATLLKDDLDARNPTKTTGYLVIGIALVQYNGFEGRSGPNITYPAMLIGCGPPYLTDLCRPVSDFASRRALRSSARGQLLVPRPALRLNIVELSLLLVPSTWNELPLTLRLLPRNNVSSFCKLLKTFLFGRSWTESAFLQRVLYKYPQSIYV